LVDYGDDTLQAIDRAGKVASRLDVHFVADDLVWAWTGPQHRPSWNFLIEPIVRYARAAWVVSETQFVAATGLQHSVTTNLTLHHLLLFSRLLE
jgi:hypothetical protein